MRAVDRRPAEAFVHSGPVVIVSARVAEKLLTSAGLASWAIEHRGEDVEVDVALVAFKRAAAARAQRFRQVPSEVPGLRNVALSRRLLTVKQAAEVLGVSDRAVRKAIVEQRLHATRVGHGWQITDEGLMEYQPRKART